MDKFPTIIKQLRETRNLTQKELSEMLGMKTYTTITKWEAGENFPKGKDIKRLAEIFSVTSDFLLGLEEKDDSSRQNINSNFERLSLERQEQLLELSKYDLDRYILNTVEYMSKSDERLKKQIYRYAKLEYSEYEKEQEEKNVDSQSNAG